MLIDTRALPPTPDDPRPRRSLHPSALRLALVLASGLGLILASGAFPPVLSYVLILVGCILLGRGLGTLVCSAVGLENYRQ